MRELCHRYDHTRMMCVATSGGPNIVVLPTLRLNYILQNPVEQQSEGLSLSRKAVELRRDNRLRDTRHIFRRPCKRAHDSDKQNQKAVGTRSTMPSNAAGNSMRTSVAGGLFSLDWIRLPRRPNPMEFPATVRNSAYWTIAASPKTGILS